MCRIEASEYIESNSVHSLQSSIYPFDPLTDARWNEFLQRQTRPSVFHTLPWLDALRRTYGYEPVAFTTSPPNQELRSAIVLCRINSWLTGRRLVSLPFSDHCDLLTDSTAETAAYFPILQKELRQSHLRYVEVRPTHGLHVGIPHPYSTYSYCLHQLDLTPDIDTLFYNCHKNSTQRKIRRAEREGLVYEEGRSEPMLNHFYRLLVQTRRRHNLPPQPMHWFQNLVQSFGEALKIRLAFHGSQPIAGIITIRYKRTLLYKYGCSDARFHNLGCMHFLLWRSILEAKREGLSVFDLGRSEWGAKGLIMFKDRWGTQRSTLTYIRLLSSEQSSSKFISRGTDWTEWTAKHVIPYLPDSMICAISNVLCRHFG